MKHFVNGKSLSWNTS